MADPSAAPSAAPSALRRIGALDVIRGVAIIGTFGTNVWIFTELGGAAAWSPTAGDGAGVGEQILRAVPNGKFLALLTLLFGIGLELQYRAAVRRGLRWPHRYLRRGGILLAEGLVHYLLVFEYDVLMGYAITSMIVAYLIGRSDTVIRRIIWGLGSVYGLFVAALTALLVSTASLPEPATVLSTASWPAQVLNRVENFGYFRAEAVFIVPSAVVLFLVAARLLRAGVFDDTAPAHRLRGRLLWWGFGVGVPLNAWTVWAGSDWFLVERYVVGPLIAMGLLAMVIELVTRIRRPGVVQGWLSSVGRTALSCYVLQNVVACVLCYDWGLGLNARLAGLGPLWPVGLWLLVFAVNVAFATLWLRRHDRGPLELLAHRLA